MIVVMISGKQGSGKTSLSKAILPALMQQGLAAVALKFADPLYLMHDAVYGVLAQFGIPKPATKDGDLLQLLGTEWGKSKFGEAVWANLLKNRVSILQEQIEKATPDYPYERVYVVDDLRFPIEFDAYPEAIKIRLECDRDLRKARAEYWREKEFHRSEVELDSYSAGNAFDLVIDTGVHNAEATLQMTAAFIKRKLAEEKETACKSTSTP